MENTLIIERQEVKKTTHEITLPYYAEIPHSYGKSYIAVTGKNDVVMAVIYEHGMPLIGTGGTERLAQPHTQITEEAFTAAFEDAIAKCYKALHSACPSSL